MSHYRFTKTGQDPYGDNCLCALASQMDVPMGECYQQTRWEVPATVPNEPMPWRLLVLRLVVADPTQTEYVHIDRKWYQQYPAWALKPDWWGGDKPEGMPDAGRLNVTTVLWTGETDGKQADKYADKLATANADGDYISMLE